VPFDLESHLPCAHVGTPLQLAEIYGPLPP
jgi:hypothetical protein